MKKITAIIFIFISINSFGLQSNMKGNGETVYLLSDQQKKEILIVNKLNAAESKDINLILNEEFDNDSKKISEFIDRNELYDLITESDKNVE